MDTTQIISLTQLAREVILMYAQMFQPRKLTKIDAVLVGLLGLAFAGCLMAAGASGFPWEAAGTAIQTSFAGQVALAVTVIGIVGAGGGLILNQGQFSQFVAVGISTALIGGFLLGTVAILGILYPGAGAAIG